MLTLTWTKKLVYKLDYTYVNVHIKWVTGDVNRYKPYKYFSK